MNSKLHSYQVSSFGLLKIIFISLTHNSFHFERTFGLMRIKLVFVNDEHLDNFTFLINFYSTSDENFQFSLAYFNRSLWKNQIDALHNSPGLSRAYIYIYILPFFVFRIDKTNCLIQSSPILNFLIQKCVDRQTSRSSSWWPSPLIIFTNKCTINHVSFIDIKFVHIMMEQCAYIFVKFLSKS